MTFVAYGFKDLDGEVQVWRFDLDGNGPGGTPFPRDPAYKTSRPAASKAQGKAQGMDEDGEVSPATLGQFYVVVGAPTAAFKVVAKKQLLSAGTGGGAIHPLQKISFDGSASAPGAFSP